MTIIYLKISYQIRADQFHYVSKNMYKLLKEIS